MLATSLDCSFDALAASRRDTFDLEDREGHSYDFVDCCLWYSAQRFFRAAIMFFRPAAEIFLLARLACLGATGAAAVVGFNSRRMSAIVCFIWVSSAW